MKKNENMINFWENNKDNIIASIIAAVIAGLILYVILLIIKKIRKYKFKNIYLSVKNRFNKFRKKNYGIIFAFPKEILDDGTVVNEKLILEEREQISVLYYNLRDELAKYKISITRIKKSQMPVNQDDVDELLKNKKATLVIWGDVMSGNVKGVTGKVTEIKNLTFSYNFKNISIEDQKTLKGYIDFYMIGKNKAINHKNDKEDREKIAMDIKNTSCFILAIILTWKKRFEESYKIFNRLEKEINIENGDLEKKFLESVRVTHAYAYSLECQKIGLRAFPSKKNKEKIEALTEKIIETSPLIKGYYTFKSIIQFWNRDIDGAINSLDYAPNNFTTYFDKAFLFYYKNEIKSGWIYLRKAIKGFEESKKYEKDIIVINRNKKFIKDIVEFYKDVIKKEPNKPLLLFPLSYLVYSLLNKKKANKYSKKLLDENNNLNLNDDEKYILKRKGSRMINGLE
ncbi:MAG TPA: hypothetical protein VIK86_03390 [Candidatus Paceibacterota bacterium]